MTATLAMEKMVSERLADVDPAWRRALLSLSIFPPSPNTFSEAAAVAVTQIDLRVLEDLATAGLLDRPRYGRYEIKELVIQAVSGNEDPNARGRMLDHYKAYARTHAHEFHALNAECFNLMKCLSLARQLDMSTFARLVMDLGELFELRGDHVDWRRLLLEAETVDAIGTEERATLALQLARVHEKLGDNRSALTSAHAGLDMLPAHSEQIGPFLALIGHIEMNMGGLKKAREHLLKAFEVTKDASQPAQLSVLVSLGIVETRLGNYDEASTYTYLGIENARRLNELAMLTSFLTNLGVILYHRGRHKEALEVETEGLEIAKQIGYSEKQAALLDIMAGSLTRLGDLKGAEERLREALTIATRIGHSWYVTTILNGLGIVLLNSGRIDEAIATFREAIEDRPTSTPDVFGYSLFGLAQSLMKRGLKAEAQASAAKSLMIFASMQHHATVEVRQWVQDTSISTAHSGLDEAPGRGFAKRDSLDT